MNREIGIDMLMVNSPGITFLSRQLNAQTHINKLVYHQFYLVWHYNNSDLIYGACLASP